MVWEAGELGSTPGPAMDFLDVVPPRQAACEDWAIGVNVLSELTA